MISVFALLGVFVLGVVLASPIAKSRTQAEARKRGLILQVEDFNLGWFQAELSGVTLSLEGVQEIETSIDKMLVDVALTSPRLRQIVITGGRATIDGSFEQVKKSLEGWQNARPPVNTEGQSQAKRSRVEIVRQLDITWKGALGGQEKQTISGLQAERSSEGLRLGAAPPGGRVERASTRRRDQDSGLLQGAGED